MDDRYLLSLNKGNPIAFIEEGINKGKILSIIDKNAKCSHNNCKHGECKKCIKGGCQKCGGDIDNELNTDKLALSIENYIRNMKGRINFRKIQILKEYVQKNIEPVDLDIKKMYHELMKLINETKNKEIKLYDSYIVPVFDPNKERSIFYISGISGCGKSRLTSKLCVVYHKMYPKNKIYLFSQKEIDPAYDDKQYIERIKIDESLYGDPIKCNELKNSLVIFDDIDCVANKNIEKELDRLRDMILQQGRSYYISFIYISHMTNNYKQTRLILCECTHLVLFPKCTHTYALGYCLGKYFGFDKSDIKKIQSLPTDWVTIHKNPRYILHEKGGYIL